MIHVGVIQLLMFFFIVDDRNAKMEALGSIKSLEKFSYKFTETKAERKDIYT